MQAASCRIDTWHCLSVCGSTLRNMYAQRTLNIRYTNSATTQNALRARAHRAHRTHISTAQKIQENNNKFMKQTNQTYIFKCRSITLSQSHEIHLLRSKVNWFQSAFVCAVCVCVPVYTILANYCSALIYMITLRFRFLVRLTLEWHTHSMKCVVFFLVAVCIFIFVDEKRTHSTSFVRCLVFFPISLLVYVLRFASVTHICM